MSGTNHKQAIAAAAIGTAAIGAYAVAAAIQILLLNPLAAASGRGLTEIAADLRAAGESVGLPFVVAVLGMGVLAAIAMFVLTARRPEIPLPFVVVAYLGLLALGAVAYVVASFGAGMALADTYGVEGSDHAPWASVLYLVSAFAGVFGVAVTISSIRSTRRSNIVPA